jgi:hypothetical protein
VTFVAKNGPKLIKKFRGTRNTGLRNIHMNKPVAGVLFGAALGFCDGLTVWFTPAARSAMTGILAGLFARKVRSVPMGIAFGAAVELFFAWLVALQPQPDGSHYYVEIMVPGFVVGAIIGF